MRGNLRKHCILNSEKGASAVLVAIMITMFFGFAALAIDLGYGFVTKNQLQNVADAAALAATRWLGCKYAGNTDASCPAAWQPMIYDSVNNCLKLSEDQPCYDATNDASTIIDVARNVANQNTVADQDSAGANKFVIEVADVEIGTWDPNQTVTFVPTYLTPNAVRVTAKRAEGEGSNGAISTFIANAIEIYRMSIRARAVAALTGQSTAGEGGLPIPVGISCYWAQNAACGDTITFYPTGTSCAGWNTYTSTPANASKLGNILDGGNSGSSPNLMNCALFGTSDTRCLKSPETIAGSTQFIFTGGTVASAFPDMENLFNAMKVLNTKPLDQDTNSATWTTTVPIYGNLDGTCTPCGAGQSNPSGPQLVVGFATIEMTEVTGSSSKELHGQLVCGALQPGRGGGSPRGTVGSIPGLVK